MPRSKRVTPKPAKIRTRPLVKAAAKARVDNKPRREPKTTVRKKIDRGGRRWYSDEERCAILNALEANGGNMQRTARECGIPISTLSCWANGHRCPEALLLRTEKKGDLATAVEELAWLFAACIPEKVAKAPLNHLTAGLGIMVEKMRLLRGEHTTYGRSEANSTNVNLNANLLNESERHLLAILLAKARGAVTELSGGEPVPEASPRPQLSSQLPGVLA